MSNSIIQIFQIIASAFVIFILVFSLGFSFDSPDIMTNILLIGENILLWGGILWLINRDRGVRFTASILIIVAFFFCLLFCFDTASIATDLLLVGADMLFWGGLLWIINRKRRKQ